MRTILVMTLIFFTSSFYGGDEKIFCDSLKKDFKIIFDLKKYTESSFSLVKSYEKCLKANSLQNVNDFAFVNMYLGNYYRKKDNYNLAFEYFFESKNLIEELLKKSKYKNDARIIDYFVKILNNITVLFYYSSEGKFILETKYKNKESSFLKDYLTFLLKDDIRTERINNLYTKFQPALNQYIKNYTIDGPIDRKAVDKILRKVYPNKEIYLEKDFSKNLYQQIGYRLRKLDDPDWSFVEDLYKKNLEDQEASSENKIKALDAIAIMLMNKEEALNNNDTSSVFYFKKLIELYNKNNDQEKLKSTYETIGKAFYKCEYYKRSTDFWELKASLISSNNGSYTHEYVSIIDKLRITYKKFDLQEQERCEKIILNIKSQIKNPIDYKIISLASSKDGNSVVAGTDNGKIKIWNRLENNTKKNWISVEHLPGDNIENVFVKPSGDYVLSLGKYDLKLWTNNGSFIGRVSIKDTSLNTKQVSFYKQDIFEFNGSFYGFKSDSTNKLKKVIQNYPTKIASSDFKTEIKDGSLSLLFKDKTIITDLENNVKKSCVSDGDDDVRLIFASDANGLINVWEFDEVDLKQKSILKKIDSLDLRRKPKLYFISFTSDSLDYKLSNDFLNKLKFEIRNSRYFDIEGSHPKFFKQKEITSNSIVDFHDSLREHVYHNDFIIYYFSGFDNQQKFKFMDSSTYEIDNFYKISEKISSTKKLFFIDSDNSFSVDIRKQMDSEANKVGFEKENKIIISQDKGRKLTECYLSSDSSTRIMDLFKQDHRLRTEFLHKLYSYVADLIIDNNSNYRLKSYFQKDGFELDTKDFDISIDRDNKIKFKHTLAILVGVDQYQKKLGLDSLITPLNDIDSVKNMFLNSFNNIKIETIINPTSSSFPKELDDILDNYEFNKGSQVLFYFAGHGVNHEDVSSILFKDSKYDKDYGPSNHMTFEELVKKFNSRIINKGLQKSLIILDACQQGEEEYYFTSIKDIDLQTSNNYNGEQIKFNMLKNASIVITSTSKDDNTPDGKIISPFCKNFCQSLKDIKLREFSNHELFESLRNLSKKENKTLRHFKLKVRYSDNDQLKPMFFFFRKNGS